MVLRPETEKRGHNRPIILMPHQTKGGDFLMNSVTALLYWDQGTGKTFATTKGLELLQRKGALTKPIHDVSKYVLNSRDSECALADCCPCNLATREVDDDSPIILERQPPWPRTPWRRTPTMAQCVLIRRSP